MHRFSEAVGVPSSPHIIFWPFSLHGSTSYFLYSWRRLPCLASQSCLLSLHSWLFISIFDIFLEVVPFEMVIVMVHVTQRNRDLFSSELLKCRYFLTQASFLLAATNCFPQPLLLRFSRCESNTVTVSTKLERTKLSKYFSWVSLLTWIKVRRKHPSHRCGVEQCTCSRTTLSLSQRFSVLALLTFGAGWVFGVGLSRVLWDGKQHLRLLLTRC